MAPTPRTACFTKPILLSFQLAPVTPPLIPEFLSQFVFGGGRYSALYFNNSSPARVSFTANFTVENGARSWFPTLGSIIPMRMAECDGIVPICAGRRVSRRYKETSCEQNSGV